MERGSGPRKPHRIYTPVLVADAHCMCSVRTTLVYCFNWLRKYDVLFVNSQRGYQIAVTAIRYWRHSTRRIRLWFDCSVFCCNCTVSRATYSRSLFQVLFEHDPKIEKWWHNPGHTSWILCCTIIVCSDSVNPVSQSFIRLSENEKNMAAHKKFNSKRWVYSWAAQPEV